MDQQGLNATEREERDFRSARMRALLRRLWALLHSGRGSNILLSSRRAGAH